MKIAQLSIFQQCFSPTACSNWTVLLPKGRRKDILRKRCSANQYFLHSLPFTKDKKDCKGLRFFFPQKCMTAAFLLWELCTFISWGCTGKQIVNLCHTFIFFFCNTSAPPKPPAHKCLGALKIRFGRTKKLPLMTILDRWMQLWFC